MKRHVLLITGLALAAGGVLTLSGPGAEAGPRLTVMLNPNHNCSDCHATHNGDGPDLLRATDVEVLCLTCHGPGGPSILKAENHEGQTCMVCHDPHDGQFNRYGNRNIKMMRAEVVPEDSDFARPLVLESRGTHVGEPSLRSFCDDDEDSDGIWDNACDTCHSDEPDRHQYTDPNSHRHRTGDTCTRCHDHQDGFDK